MEVPYSNLNKGALLVASPDLEGAYYRTIILLCEHSSGGSFGLILNKSLEIELPEDLLNLKEMANQRVHVRAGGPIQPNQMMLLHSSNEIPDQTLRICEGVYLGGDLPFLQ